MVPRPINPLRSQGGYPPTHLIPTQTSVNPGTTTEHYTNSLGAQEGQTQTPTQSRGNTLPPFTPQSVSVLPRNPILIVPYLKMDYHKPSLSPLGHSPIPSSSNHPGIQPGTVPDPGRVSGWVDVPLGLGGQLG